MNTIDLIIFIAYCLLILCVGLFVSRGRKGDERDAGDYFLAGRGLAWWAIGASIIASNISAEQFVGMSGSGYAIGLAMATYEWIAALGLILVAKFFIPIFLEKMLHLIIKFNQIRIIGFRPYKTNMVCFEQRMWKKYQRIMKRLRERLIFGLQVPKVSPKWQSMTGLITIRGKNHWDISFMWMRPICRDVW